MDNTHNFVHYKIFEPFENLVAFTTTKQTFSFQNPRFTGDSPEIFKNNRTQLAAKVGIMSKQLIFPRQTHTNCVAEILNLPESEIKGTDALVSDQTGSCLCIQTADCVPILLFDPIQKVISAVHAGWRGTVNKIVEVAVQKMISKYNSLPQNIIAAIGPSISPEIYEVGNEVATAAKKAIPNAEITLKKNSSGKFHFNLWEANRQILLANQIAAQHIEILGECSFLKTDTYFSARKEGIETGRMVSGIMLLSSF